MKQRATIAISLDGAGFTTTDGARVAWAEVDEIIAFKEDLFSFDEIRLGFGFDGGGNYHYASESDSGYEELLAALAQNFPGIRTDWFKEVAFPPFEANRTILWSKTV